MDAVSAVIHKAVIYMPFAELVDIVKEIERLKGHTFLLYNAYLCSVTMKNMLQPDTLYYFVSCASLSFT